jgi:hypothetical protein
LAAHDLILIATQSFLFCLACFNLKSCDARMRNEQSKTKLSAPLTIGLGPNFIAGATVHAAIETDGMRTLGK